MTNLIDQSEHVLADLRDRTASTLATSDAPEYASAMTRRALERLADRVEDLRDSISGDLDATADRMKASIDAMRADDAPSTSWLARFTWMAIGAGVGTAAAMLLDDGAATERRERLTTRAQELADDAKASAQHHLEVQKGKAQGAANLRSGARDTDDPKLLRQKIRSEVVGRVEGADDVVVIVHDAGRVELKGLVDSREVADELVTGIEQVSGVNDVTESLQVNVTQS